MKIEIYEGCKVGFSHSVIIDSAFAFIGGIIEPPSSIKSANAALVGAMIYVVRQLGFEIRPATPRRIDAAVFPGF
jgi:hypothetical protein